MNLRMRAAGFCCVLLICLGPTARLALAQGVAFAQTNYSVGGTPTSVVVADFNGDNKPDLAVANSGSNSVSILLGNGDGTFAAKTDFTTGQQPVCVATGDFNGDNKLDLVTANLGANSISILLGNGNGTFGAPTSFPSGTGPVFVVVGLFDAGTNLDVAVANVSADTISVLLGNGNGTFAAKTDFLTGAQPNWLLVADFNGDTKLDLASANVGSNTVSVLLGNGDGTFGAKADFATGVFPRGVAAADFRNATKRDLATANTSDSSTSVLLGRGDGTFDPRTDLGTDTQPLAVTAADFDNDGKPDLLTSNYGFTYFYYGSYYSYPTVSLFRGNGDGTFSARTDFGIGVSLSPDSVASADLNGDGRIDVVTANASQASVSVLLQSAAISLSAFDLNFATNQGVGTTSPPQTVTVSSTGSLDLMIGAITLEGTNPSSFNKVADTCSNATVPSGNTCDISITFTPASSGEKRATVRIPSNAAGNPHFVGLFGWGASMGTVSLNNTSLSFGDQFVGTTSAAQRVTMTNTGSGTLTFFGFSVSGDFTANTNCPGTLAVNASCFFDVFFSPSSLGPKAGTVSIVTDTLGSPNTISLAGNGTPAPAVSLSSSLLDFGERLVGSSTMLGITLTNSGGAPLLITSITAFGAPVFTQSNDCPLSPASLAIAGTCTITVMFSPDATFDHNGLVSIVSNAPGSPHTVELFGVGFTLPGVMFSPTSVNFGGQIIGTTSAAQSITLTNTGDGSTQSALTITSISITGTDAGDFVQTNDCPLSPTTLGPSTACTIMVTFGPATVGAKSAAVSVSSDAAGSPHMAALNGTGVTPPNVMLSATSLTFSAQIVGTTSTAQTVTLTNSGGFTLTITSIVVGGANAGDFMQTNNCGTSVAAGANCTITVTFRPGGTGTRTATITITDNAAGSPRQISLTGTGTDFSVAPETGSPTTATITAGQSANFQLSLSGSGGFSGTVTISCSGTIPLGMCSVSPSSATLGATPVTVMVTVTTTAGGLAAPRAWPETPPLAPVRLWPLLLWLTLAAFLWQFGRFGKRVPVRAGMLPLALLLLVGMLLTSCGGGNGAPGTPPGSYPLTVSVSSGGATRTISLNVTVR